MTLPRYIAARHIAIALGPEWRTQRVSRILTAMGIARKLGKARGVFVTPEDLAGAWPEMFEGILERLEVIETAPEKMRHRIPIKKRSKLGGVGDTAPISQCEHVWVCHLPATDAHCEKCGILA